MSPADPRFANVKAAAARIAVVLVLMALTFWLARCTAPEPPPDRAGALVRDSLEAALDTQRVHLMDSLRVTERRAVQATIERDSVSRLLGMETRARAQAELRVTSLETELSAVVTSLPEDSAVRVVDVEQRTETPPATVSLRALVWPDTASVTLRLALDPIPLTAYVGCDLSAGKESVRPARVAIAGPGWVDVELGELVTAPGVCSPAPLELSTWERMKVQAPAFGWGVGAGVVLSAALFLWLGT